MKRATLLITALMGMFLASCGTSGGPEGYMASSPNSVIFIDWTNNNNQLSGMLQTASLDNSLALHSQSSQLSGVVSGSNVSLTLSLWGFPTQTYVGTISNDQLTLSISQSNGTLQTVVLTPATTDDYNNVVQSLQATATAQQNTQTAQQNAQQNTQTAQQNAQATAQAISAAQSQLSNALSALQHDSDFSGILSSYSSDITSAKNDLQNEQQATDCNDKQYYKQAVEFDASLVSGPTSDDSRFNNLYLSSAENDIQAIKQASQILNQPIPDISQAQNAINSAKAKVAGYDGQIKQIVAQAKAVLGQC